MSTEITVPALGESVTEATVAQWYKQIGDTVAADEPLVELETDKVTVEVPAPTAGVLTEILVADGTNVEVGAILGAIAEGAAAAPAEAPSPKPAAAEPAAPAAPATPAAPTPAPAAPSPANVTLSPAVRKLVDDNKLDPAPIPATGAKGQLTKADVLAYLEQRAKAPAAPKQAAAPTPAAAAPTATIVPASSLPERAPDARGEEVVRMSRLRQRIAERLKQAQNNAAMLTTFNEVDMGALMQLRTDYRDTFEKKHGVRLGFLSFFIKAAILALKEIPAVNAEIHGDQLIYKNYYDIGVAVGTPQGLVVPVLRDADKISFAEIERTIADFGARAREGKLTIAEMTGGTFTISNGGVYGSLLSTPILNPPQSGILGMHKIQKRPMVVGDEIKICNMMYLAMSYDHRIVDGREAVTFLVRMKECLEDPQRLLIDV
ncbi:MAG: 2-oxoglutarate dehydrogenase complex dihydrolipoyllysine-residue succinyltransferase [Rhodospirillaceae bacterium]|jgi:2-oxoglutarate dehydrogenase E2 component (dihydrolipoamide succinyltransferase)|nr:2-oxoglutarate dehydrogenase complex dihydrolipoyllysine-residue succinyltransferase [Rhodospirillaceae bacterium]